MLLGEGRGSVAQPAASALPLTRWKPSRKSGRAPNGAGFRLQNKLAQILILA